MQSRFFSAFAFFWAVAVPLAAQPPAPAGFSAEAFGRHIELRWQAVGAASGGYEIWRSPTGGAADFDLLKKIPGGNAVRNFHLDWTGDEGATVSRWYKIRSLGPLGTPGDFSAQISAATRDLTDAEMLEMVQRSTFRYFWEHAHPLSGMARERDASGDVVTTGGTGFGLMATVVAAERGWISRAEAVNRLLTVVSFLQFADRFHGVFPHWMDGRTGNVVPFSQFDDGADLVETAFLMQGLLTVRQYFSKNDPLENALRDVATGLWEDVEWDFFRKNNSPVLYWHWSPNFGWQMNFPLRGFNETMICYLLAIASPTHPVPASLYASGWAAGGYANPSVHFGQKIYCGPFGGGPLFFGHYSFLGFDPRARKDAFCNYFTRNRNHALIQHAYAVANPEHHAGYSANCWGLTASDDPWGYLAHDIHPANDNGTVSPTAALSSMPYAPAESTAAMRYFYEVLGERLWGEFGFYDAFNLDENWFAKTWLAIDQGPIICMLENHRTGLLWDVFMSNPEIQPALDAIGFVPDVSAAGDFWAEKSPGVFLTPNPVASGQVLRAEMDGGEIESAALFDLNGICRKRGGGGANGLETAGLPAGVYLLKIKVLGGKMVVRKVVVGG